MSNLLANTFHQKKIWKVWAAIEPNEKPLAAYKIHETPVLKL